MDRLLDKLFRLVSYEVLQFHDDLGKRDLNDDGVHCSRRRECFSGSERERWRRAVHQTATARRVSLSRSRQVCHVCWPSIAGSRGKLIYSIVDRRTMHVLFADHQRRRRRRRRRDRSPTNVGKLNADAQKCFSCNQSNFYCGRPQPRRTSIRPVGSGAAQAAALATISAGLIDCRASCNYSTSGAGWRRPRAAFIGYYLS